MISILIIFQIFLKVNYIFGVNWFENSLAFDDNSCTSTKVVYIAKNKNKMIGIVGASETCVNTIWEIGVDVIKEYRNNRLATYLVAKLTQELLIRNIIPFYSASTTNIASHMVANKSGYVPIWVDTFGTILDGSSVYSDIVNVLSL